jgi:hypothetical protein
MKSKPGMEKKDIALVQLRRAIQLLREGDLVCCATLAGAAEEILGRIAKARSGTNALEGNVEFLGQVAEHFQRPRPAAHRVIQRDNQHRNELKHNDDGENRWYAADYEFEAQELIDRAIRNYCLAYGEYPQDRIIRAYVTAYHT